MDFFFPISSFFFPSCSFVFSLPLFAFTTLLFPNALSFIDILYEAIL